MAMTGIFLSYRRTDSAHAVLILHRLAEEFGHDAVFFDREDIRLGRDYLRVIDDALKGCACFVALIGPGWLASLERLKQPADVVTRELRAGLKPGKFLVPAFVGNATLPVPPALPASLARLPKQNGILLRDEFFEEDLERLLLALRAEVDAGKPKRRRASEPTRDRFLHLLHDLQMDALRLIGSGQVEKALDGLYSGMGILMAELQKTPADLRLSTHLAYFYKDLGVGLRQVNQAATAAHYLRLGGSLLRRLLPRAVSLSDRASILNGLGNALFYQGSLDAAIERYRQAVAIAPDYAYAWHDLYLAYLEQARLGTVDRRAMRTALDKLKQSAPGSRGLDSTYIRRLERLMPRAS